MGRTVAAYCNLGKKTGQIVKRVYKSMANSLSPSITVIPEFCVQNLERSSFRSHGPNIDFLEPIFVEGLGEVILKGVSAFFPRGDHDRKLI